MCWGGPPMPCGLPWPLWHPMPSHAAVASTLYIYIYRVREYRLYVCSIHIAYTLSSLCLLNIYSMHSMYIHVGWVGLKCPVASPGLCGFPCPPIASVASHARPRPPMASVASHDGLCGLPWPLWPPMPSHGLCGIYSIYTLSLSLSLYIYIDI